MARASLRIPFWTPLQASLAQPSVLRYEVHLLGLPQPVHGLRSLRLLVGTIGQCQKYALEARSSVSAVGLSIRVRPSSGSSIFLDPDDVYPQEVRSLEELIRELPPLQKEAHR